MAYYSFSVPVISGATLAPSPADMNTAVTLSVTVAEQTVSLPSVDHYCGEFYAGEV